MADDFSANTSTVGRVSVNSSAYGTVETAGDHDWFQVLLNAGTTYIFSEDGVSGGVGTLNDSVLGPLRNSAGVAIAGTGNDDISLSNNVKDSQFVYTPTVSGAYYVDASGFGNDTGTYRVSVETASPSTNFTTGNDTVTIPSANQSGTWYANDGNDVVTGSDSGDVLLGGSGNDTLIGGGDAPLSTYGGEVFRLYQAALGRTPDVAGFQNWVSTLNTGTPLLTVASSFVNSQEFQNVYGALSNTQFVDLLYQNVLGRGPDPSGEASWLSVLNSGGSRESVLLGFSESPEFQASTNISSQAWSSTSLHGDDYGEIYRLYQSTLNREPDAAGFENWVNQLGSGVSLETITSGFVNSQEFQLTYGNLTNSQFVSLLYNNVLHRAPDAAGAANWVNALNNGATRNSVVLGFSNSAELQTDSAAALQNYLQNDIPSFGSNLNGGSGSNVMLGGRGNNTFVFNKDDASQSSPVRDDVYGAQNSDTLQFIGFNYTNLQATSHMLQSGQDVVFSDQNTTIDFHNTTVAAISHLRYVNPTS